MSAPKLPLTIRKNIKDGYESKKDELAKQWKTLFGVDYEFAIDFPTLYADTDPSQQGRIGDIVSQALSGAHRVIEYETKHGEDKLMIDGFNDVVSKHTVTVIADPETKSYSGCRVKDGVFEIMFKPQNVGTNCDTACKEWKKALNDSSSKANPKALPLAARASIKKNWDAEKAGLEEKLAKELGGEKLTIHTDFQDIWNKLVDAHESLPEHKKRDIDLERLAPSLGGWVMGYFEGLANNLKSELKGDELMVEGFLETVEEKEAWFGLINESETLQSSYCHTSIDDGKIWCKSKPTQFGVNTNRGFQGFAKLL